MCDINDKYKIKVPFDKVYVLSLPSFKSRYKFMEYQLNDLGIPFEFMWGVDLGNINKDSLDYEIKYPQAFEEEQICTGKDFSCSLNHYSAVYQAYEFGLNSILILEDDVCFLKNKDFIERSLNNIPKDADFVTWDPRCVNENDIILLSNNLKKCKTLYIKNNRYNMLFGGMMYALMNRKTMKLYLDNQRKQFFLSDHVQGLFMNVTVNKYISTKCLCTDHINMETNFNIYKYYKKLPEYICRYGKQNINKFYIPKGISRSKRMIVY